MGGFIRASPRRQPSLQPPDGSISEAENRTFADFVQDVERIVCWIRLRLRRWDRAAAR
jgi:hypothetical protein